MLSETHTRKYTTVATGYLTGEARPYVTYIHPCGTEDLIILTLEVLTRNPVANAAVSQREAFRGHRRKCRQIPQADVLLARDFWFLLGSCGPSCRFIELIRHAQEPFKFASRCRRTLRRTQVKHLRCAAVRDSPVLPK